MSIVEKLEQIGIKAIIMDNKIVISLEDYIKLYPEEDRNWDLCYKKETFIALSLVDIVNSQSVYKLLKSIRKKGKSTI